MTAATVANMIRELALLRGHAAGSGVGGCIPEPAAQTFQGVLTGTAEMITGQAGRAVRGDPAAFAPDEATSAATQARRTALTQVKQLEDPLPLVAAGSLIRDAQKIEVLLSNASGWRPPPDSPELRQ